MFYFDGTTTSFTDWQAEKDRLMDRVETYISLQFHWWRTDKDIFCGLDIQYMFQLRKKPKLH